jgi:riboflavin synthase
MFTGLIADLGTVSALELGEDGATVRIRSRLARELQEGDSVSVDGVCVTASDVGGEEFAAQLMAETLERSALAALGAGAQVNLELPLRASDRLGGHVVQGHVDGTGSVVAAREQGFARVLEIETDARLARYLVEKGSVAINGVSLTVTAVGEHGFSVSLIPETLQRTNLGRLGRDDVVNLEVDVLAKHVERLLDVQARSSGEAVTS